MKKPQLTSCPIPEFLNVQHKTLKTALDEKAYLQDFPKPKRGWHSSIGNKIESRLLVLNKVIADMVLEKRSSKNERRK